MYARLDHCLGIGWLQDRLLLMPGTLAEHAVKAQADEQCHQCEDDDYGQSFEFRSFQFLART